MHNRQPSTFWNFVGALPFVAGAALGCNGVVGDASTASDGTVGGINRPGTTTAGQTASDRLPTAGPRPLTPVPYLRSVRDLFGGGLKIPSEVASDLVPPDGAS